MKSMSQQKVSLLLLISLFALVSCSNPVMGMGDSDKAAIRQVIENHEKTLIFVSAEYCHACKSMLEKNIKPYLEGLEKNNVGIVIVYYGNEDIIADLVSDNRLIITTNMRFPLLIKKDANKTMKSLLKNFKETNAMPIPLLVDKDGFVLNYDDKNGYPSYLEIINAAK